MDGVGKRMGKGVEGLGILGKGGTLMTDERKEKIYIHHLAVYKNVGQ